MVFAAPAKVIVFCGELILVWLNHDRGTFAGHCRLGLSWMGSWRKKVAIRDRLEILRCSGILSIVSTVRVKQTYLLWLRAYILTEQVLKRTLFRKVLTCILHETVFLVQVHLRLSDVMLFVLMFCRRLADAESLLILLGQFDCLVRGTTCPFIGLREGCTTRGSSFYKN